VDKTEYLARMEDVASFLFFIRPRRFGKSLFISMMRAYYDKAMAARFDELFGGLWVGSHPTPWQGKFQVLYFDFSRVGGDLSKLESQFNSYCCIELNAFMSRYAADYPEEVRKSFSAVEDVSFKLNTLNAAAHELGIPLYLIVDEYDNFTNVILNQQGEEVYHAITHADGFYRDIFKLFKGMFERIFLIGVSPVTLDDLTSGFNIATNISTDSRFNDMLGFTTADVRKMVGYYKDAGLLPADRTVDDIVEEMRPWYDNYCFAKQSLKDESRVFNPDMALRYLSSYTGTGAPPDDMLDPNTKTDYKKMRRLLQLDSLQGERSGVLRKITEEGQIVSSIVESFPANRLTDPDMFISLLFYYGMLTIKEMRGASMILAIPNNNVRQQYYEYLLEQYKPAAQVERYVLDDAYYLMAYEGDWQKALRYIGEAYERVSSIRDSIEGERNLQGFFMAYLSLSAYYLTAPEVEVSHGYCDFFLMPDLRRYDVRHSYILELKYLPKKDFESRAAAQWGDAVEQIGRYAAAQRVLSMTAGTTLHKIVMQFEGWTLKRMEEV
ncbi:ATP-binding protein, partial [Salmonella enterica]|nr:ATP-binding protein [Salmonella enterica]